MTPHTETLEKSRVSVIFMPKKAKRADNRYAVQVYLGKDENGNQIYGSKIYADFKGDGNWSYYQISGIDANVDGVLDDSEKFTYAPKDHIIFRIDAADMLYGNLLVNIKIENGTDKKEFETEIPEYKAPQDAPIASRQGFDLVVGGNDGYCRKEC